eukprot:CAMPEP_0206461710 /NCGR_PEP_ID=MMETSP0324_2-20121206/25531_1 /ASSEMBLY_ACC=CAM_ASM_000836 /TAXON_ID=2866 /ORGANISM="Crypthecodinium cohnii, Strain Seligo" /LENGTH=45 /DNA_ID= /DNA_START= /DNA_END= /DNA_ORIENTATION=
MAPRLEKAVELLNRAVSVAEGAADGGQKEHPAAGGIPRRQPPRDH